MESSNFQKSKKNRKKIEKILKKKLRKFRKKIEKKIEKLTKFFAATSYEVEYDSITKTEESMPNTFHSKNYAIQH